jgi:hypothetical protein
MLLSEFYLMSGWRVSQELGYTASAASRKATLRKPAPARTYHHFEVIRAARTPATTAQGNTTTIATSHTRGADDGGTIDGPAKIATHETTSATRPAMPIVFPRRENAVFIADSAYLSTNAGQLPC